MRPLWVFILLLSLVVCAPAVIAQSLAVRIVAHNEGAPGSRNEHPYWFSVGGSDARDPTLNFTPGEDVTVTFTNAGDRPHQLQFGEPIGAGTPLVEPNATVTLSFRVPTNITSAPTEYWCALHKPIGMAGAVSIGGAPASKAPLSDSTRTDLIPWPSALSFLAVLALAILRRRR